MSVQGRKKQLAATLAAMLAVQTIRSVHPRTGGVALPHPRTYVAVYTLWGILGFLAELGEKPAEWAARLSMLVLLTGLVIGSAGTVVNRFLELVAGAFPIPAATTSTGPEPAPTGGVIV